MNSSAITDWPLMTLGALGKAVEEALGLWITEQEKGRDGK
jgi:hypothetical protein